MQGLTTITMHEEYSMCYLAITNTNIMKNRNTALNYWYRNMVQYTVYTLSREGVLIKSILAVFD